MYGQVYPFYSFISGSFEVLLFEMLSNCLCLLPTCAVCIFYMITVSRGVHEIIFLGSQIT